MKKEIYKNAIEPLLEQIVDICTKENIAFIAGVHVDSTEDGDGINGFCGVNDATETPLPIIICEGILRDKFSFSTTRDAEDNVLLVLTPRVSLKARVKQIEAEAALKEKEQDDALFDEMAQNVFESLANEFKPRDKKIH